MNYFSVIDQNNQTNCLLHIHSCLTFEFSHSTVMIFYQNSSSQCMNFRRRGLVWKSVAILFLLKCKTHPVLEIQTQQCHESWTGLSRKPYFIFALQVFPQNTPTGRENCSLISMILSNFPRNVNCCYCCYQQRQQRRLAILTSKCSKWNNSFGEKSIIIHWEISVNHCWKCNKSLINIGVCRYRSLNKCWISFDISMCMCLSLIKL